MKRDRSCPWCGDEKLRSWSDLSDDEREVVRRLPGSADYEASEREALHQWCTRCWFESSSDAELAV